MFVKITRFENAGNDFDVWTWMNDFFRDLNVHKFSYMAD